MPLPKRYDPTSAEPQRQERWQESGAYHFDRASDAPRFAIDTPPPPSLAICTSATSIPTAIPTSSRARLA